MDNFRKLFVCCYPTIKENEFEDFFDVESKSSNKILNDKILTEEVFNNNISSMNKNSFKEITKIKSTANTNQSNNLSNIKEFTPQPIDNKSSNKTIEKKTSFLNINNKVNENKKSSLFSKNNSFNNNNNSTSSPVRKKNSTLVSNEECSLSNSKVEDNISIKKRENKFVTSNDNNEYVIIQEMVGEKNSEESSSIVTDIDVQQNKKLELEDIEGNFLGNKKVIICAAGLEAIQSHRKSGITSFGISREHFIKDLKTNYLILPNIKEIDFEVNLKEFNNSSNVIFIISFNKYLKSYFLKPITNISDKIYMFYKLFNDVEMGLNTIISLGEFLISILKGIDDSLKIQVLNKSKIIHEFSFKSSQKLVRIGRSRINEISIQSNSFSKTQCNIYYNEELKKWYVQDGHDNIRSKNGTWVYLNREMEILDDIFIKIQEHFFAIHICK